MKLERAHVALEGLSVGDAFGEQMLHAGPQSRELALANRTAPSGRRWKWTDDTAMATSIVETLAVCDGIDPEQLAKRFVRRYAAEPDRGYGGRAHKVLSEIATGVPYGAAAEAVFDGT